MDDQIPSRFLEEIPHQFCKFEQADKWQYYEVDTYLSQWLGSMQQGPELFLYNANAVTTKTPKQSYTAQPVSPTKQAPAKTARAFKERAFEKKQITQPPKDTASCGFRAHQTVKHETFGLGVIKSIEEKKGKFFAQVQFKEGLKKIETSFLQTL
jgi:hypothetical protein